MLGGDVLKLESKQDIIQLIESDEWMMNVLFHAKKLHLPDWWVCAGFVRSKIWDTLHEFGERTPLADVDVVYFDKDNTDELIEKQYEQILIELDSSIPWSVKNEARMHLIDNFEPFLCSEDAISKFPETVTSLGVKLNDDDQVILTAPFGIEDVINLRVNPTPFFMKTEERAKIYEERIQKKNWQAIWSKIKISI